MTSNRIGGLTVEVYEKLVTLFRNFPKVEKVLLYGSRARGNYKSASDIDLSLIGGPLTLKDQLEIENALDDLLLPYKMDVNIYHNIDNFNLKGNIDKEGIVIYVRNSPN